MGPPQAERRVTLRGCAVAALVLCLVAAAQHETRVASAAGHAGAVLPPGSRTLSTLPSDLAPVVMATLQQQGNGAATTDPVFERQQLRAGPNDGFGVSVAIDGDTAVVGAHTYDLVGGQYRGAAWVFARSGTTWTQQAQLEPPDGVDVHFFGMSVALSGDTALIGALGDQVVGNRGAGFVFVRSGTTWTKQAMLQADEAKTDDMFGSSVALSGETALVGSADTFAGFVHRASAYVFVRNATTWTQQAHLEAPDSAQTEDFGVSVALAGDTAVVGVPWDSMGGIPRGAAHVFVRSGATWSLQAHLKAPDSSDSRLFGHRVALSGETALVGAVREHVGGNLNQGAAYVFVRSGTTWTQQAQLHAPDGRAHDHFGASVALSGDTALVGASQDDVGADAGINANQGSTYVFVRSGTIWTQRVHLQARKGESNLLGTSVAFSGDRALVGAYNAAFLFDLSIWGISPTSGTTAGGTAVQITGIGFAPPAGVVVGGVAATNVIVVNSTTITAVTGAHAAGEVDLVVTSGGQSTTLTGAYTYVTPPFDATTDTDADGMPDLFELGYSLDPRSATDAGADPDADGRTNLQEFQANTHPRGFFTRLLAEGATNSFFDLRLALVNPDTAPAAVLLRFLKSDGAVLSHSLTLSGMRRTTLDAKAISGLGAAEFSTVIESDVRVVVDRTMTWDASGYGSHTETSIAAAASTWYLAEGATHSGFDLFYLIQNPNSAAVTVRVRYLLPNGTVLEKDYAVAASSRFTIWVNREARTDPTLAGLGTTDLSAVLTVTSGGPIVVERAMYLGAEAGLFAAGHTSAGVTAPATNWFLAEGATGSFFDLFILLANPGAQEAHVTATYLMPGGTTVQKPYVVGPNSRRTIWVDLEDTQLADTAVSTTITVTNGVPVIAERAMWWPGPTPMTWHGAHSSPGATATGTRWALADGELGGAHAIETYILIANTSPFVGSVNVTLLFEDGTTAAKTFALNPISRFNVNVAQEFSSAGGRRFGAIVESLGATPARIVVERAMYSNAGGVVWAAGTSALATHLEP
jgi:hypothetical protein